MARTETSILIARPIEAVFAFVADPENLPRWAARTYDVTMTTTAPITVGTTFRAVGRFLNQRIESLEEVIEYEPNWQYTLRSSSGRSLVFCHAFEPDGDGTKLVFVGEVPDFQVNWPIFAGGVTRLCGTVYVASGPAGSPAQWKPLTTMPGTASSHCRWGACPSRRAELETPASGVWTCPTDAGPNVAVRHR
jgi:hypothetical protein